MVMINSIFREAEHHLSDRLNTTFQGSGKPPFRVAESVPIMPLKISLSSEK